jgi:type IV pilus assembly protein PilA
MQEFEVQQICTLRRYVSMKSDLQVKFLSFMTGRKKSEGFTLIELLVVIIIIGILAAIALPSFLNQANKAKQSEAKSYVGTLVRTQQAYYLEKSEFATTFAQLAKPVAEGTTNYTYTITGGGSGASTVNILGTSGKTALKSYGGGSAVLQSGAASEANSLGAVCEMNVAGVAPLTPTFTTGTPACPATSTLLGT